MVYAFEPNPEVANRLMGNLQANQFSNRTKVLQIGLSDQSGEAKLFIPRNGEFNRGIASIYYHERLGRESVTIQLTKMDDFVENDPSIQKVDLIKVDTEGFDAKVLFGGLNTVRRFRPIIIFEFQPDHKDEISSFLRHLDKIEYKFFRIGYFGTLIPFGNFESECDVVCLPR